MPTYNDKTITIEDVLQKAGWDYETRGGVWRRSRCPSCMLNNPRSKSKSMAINLETNGYICHSCGDKGGLFALWGALSHGIPGISHNEEKNSEYRREILGESLNSYIRPSNKNYQIGSVNTKDSTALADIASVEIRNHTYSTLFNMLSLEKKHKDNLLKRGLNEEEIEEGMYRSVPRFGETEIPAKLLSQFCTLQGVPGFYQDEKTKVWKFKVGAKGFYIPFFDLEGNITGVQIRLDEMPPDSKLRYYWLSSGNDYMGTPSIGVTHFIGKPSETVYFTEGPLKANIAHSFMKVPFIAVAGVQVLAYVEELFIQLKALGVKHIVIAYDMDYKTKIGVQRGLLKVFDICKKVGLSCNQMIWDENLNNDPKNQLKGIDDYVYYLSKKSKS